MKKISRVALLTLHDNLPKANFLYISVAEKSTESMMPATVNVPPITAHTTVMKWYKGWLLSVYLIVIGVSS